MNKRVSLTVQAHSIIHKHLNIGDNAVDATVGNGHDTLFLAKRVGINGNVFGFDIQQQAIDSTQSKLESENFITNTKLFNISHSKMEEHIPASFHGKFKVIMFNLGYLPGSDKSIITHANSTLIALKQSIKLLATEGTITVAAYPGHSGGEIETNLIKQWCEQLNPEQYTLKTIYSSEKSTAPRLFIIQPGL